MRRALILCLFACLALNVHSQAKQTLNIGFGPYPVELNPYLALYSHEMQIFSGLYEGLFSYHPETLDPLPAQIQDFKRSENSRVYTFNLRNNLRWSDGSRLTATDYVESWRYLLHPDTGAEFAVFFDIIEGAREYRTGVNKNPGSIAIRAINDFTLEVRLLAPAAYFTRLLCHSSFVPIHRSLRFVQDWSGRTIIGNGPYTLVNHNDRELRMKKTPGYWDSANVAIEEIAILFLDDEAEATRRFNSGDILWLTDMMDTSLLTLPQGIQYSAMFATSYYYWNCREAPWDDARLRRALALLVPWQVIRTEDNYFSPTDKLVLPFSGYRSTTGISQQNVEEAKALLTEAGYGDASTLPPVVLLLPDSKLQRDNAAIIARAWQSIGIPVSLQFIAGGQFTRTVRQSSYTISFSNWIGDFADPAAFLLMWTSNSTLNEGRYANPEYDTLIQNSMLQEGAERLTTLSKAETLLLQEAAVMPTNHMPSFNLVDTEALRGWHANPLDVHPFKALYFGTISELPLLSFLLPKPDTPAY
jgi:oligopeptide transport system substrate-binding protein